MVYKWKTGSVIKADAQVAGEVCEGLKNTVGLTKKNLVDASRAEDAPLHNSFEWDDAVAAESYREEQAGYIIRSLTVSVHGRKGEKMERFAIHVDSKEEMLALSQRNFIEREEKDRKKKTRKSELLKLFPNVTKRDNGEDIAVCPIHLDTEFECHGIDCKVCMKQYWEEEI